MKNVQNYQLKKCIFMEIEEFDRVFKTVFGDSLEADFGTDGICVWSREDGVEVTSVRCNDYVITLVLEYVTKKSQKSL